MESIKKDITLIAKNHISTYSDEGNSITLDPLPKFPHLFTIIMLFGFGGTGTSFFNYINKKQPNFFTSKDKEDDIFKHCRFIFPNAPRIKVTARDNMVTNSWFDYIKMGQMEDMTLEQLYDHAD